MSAFIAFLVNLVMSYPTLPVSELSKNLRNHTVFHSVFVCIDCVFVAVQGWLPNPLFPIYVHNIHKSKHGSDSGTYDKEGRYVVLVVVTVNYALTGWRRM